MIWSDETYRIYGLQPQERPMDVATIRELVHPGDREFVSRVAAKAIQGEVRADVEHRIVRPGGEVRVVAILSGPSARGAKLTVSDTVASSLQNTFEKIVTISFVTRARMGHPAE